MAAGGSDAPRVVILGAGLAGLAAAAALAPRGYAVTLVEARGRLGGRASSFHDSATGQFVDTCQHVSMGCCTNFAHFCQTLGLTHLLKPEPCLYFMTADGCTSRFVSDPVPAPLHLARSFAAAHYLTWAEKLRIAWGLQCLKRQPAEADPPFLDWLREQGQTERTVERFWGLVLTSALNEVPERIGLKYARKVFVDGFLRHRRGFEVVLPTVPLGRLYGAELLQWLARYNVHVRCATAARTLIRSGDRVDAVELRSGEMLRADAYVSAIPQDRLLDLLPADYVDATPTFAKLRRLETSPITSVHVWYDRWVTQLPHVVLVGCLGQWLFNRGEVQPGEYYVQVVVSAARQFRGLGHDEVQRRIVAEIATLFSQAAGARVLRARVITEHAATFSAVPGVDQLRPHPESPLTNLFLAGDWTATGWPATMEGAVRSGYLAAEALLRRRGQAVCLVQPDL